MRKFYDDITKIAGNVVTIKASGVGYGDLAVITTERGPSLAQVIRLEDDNVSLQIFAGTQGVGTEDKVRFLGEAMKVPFTDDLLGRVFDGSGKPRDGRPEVEGEEVPLMSGALPTVRPVSAARSRISFPSAKAVTKGFSE